MVGHPRHGPGRPPTDMGDGDTDNGDAGNRYEQIAVLLEAARADPRGGMDQLIVELTPLLWHVARAQGLDAAHCADVVQTTWLNLLRSLADIHTPAALTAWLVTATKREAWRAKDAHRQEIVASDEAFADLLDTTEGPDERAIATDQRRRLWQAVDQLSSRCQQLLRVVAFTPRPDYGLVANRLGMPRGSIGPTRGRCLAKLRELLTSDPDGEWG
jgi:RNA polymerase sigma factor (sigma-70 family)